MIFVNHAYKAPSYDEATCAIFPDIGVPQGSVLVEVLAITVLIKVSHKSAMRTGLISLQCAQSWESGC